MTIKLFDDVETCHNKFSDLVKISDTVKTKWQATDRKVESRIAKNGTSRTRRERVVRHGTQLDLKPQ